MEYANIVEILKENNLYDIEVEKQLFRCSNSCLKIASQLFVINNIWEVLKNKSQLVQILTLNKEQLRCLLVFISNTHDFYWLKNKDNFINFLYLSYTSMNNIHNLINNFYQLHFDEQNLVDKFKQLDLINMKIFINECLKLPKEELANPFILMDILKKII